MTTLLMIDNYDSFTFNLVQMFRQHPVEVIVRRSDAVTVAEARGLAPDLLVVGPGPRDPARAGVSSELLATLGREVPTLGVCLDAGDHRQRSYLAASGGQRLGQQRGQRRGLGAHLAAVVGAKG